jgi:hypothetical protein
MLDLSVTREVLELLIAVCSGVLELMLIMTVSRRFGLIACMPVVSDSNVSETAGVRFVRKAVASVVMEVALELTVVIELSNRIFAFNPSATHTTTETTDAKNMQAVINFCFIVGIVLIGRLNLFLQQQHIEKRITKVDNMLITSVPMKIMTG